MEGESEVLAAATHNPERDTFRRCSGVVWGLWSNPRERAAVYCGEMAGGEVREETKVGNGYGGKPGSHASKAILQSHT